MWLMESKSDRTGVLVVRMWVEPGHETGLRARITQTLDTSGTEREISAASSADEICDVMKKWTEDFEGSALADGETLQLPSEAGTS